MSSYIPGQGNGAPIIAPVLGVTTAAILPSTGAVTNAIQLALALAAGLVVWALVYAGLAKFSKR